MTSIHKTVSTRRHTTEWVRWQYALCLLTCMMVISCGRYAHAQTRMTRSADPNLAIGAAEYPDDDAVILRWEQHWTIEKSGAVRHREHKWIKLLNTRPIRAVADPKFNFCEGQDKFIIHTAQTILPNGDIQPVPDYSINIGATPDVAGWPVYAAWKQRIISFSGVQPGAVLELDYEVVTNPGVLLWISADLRLDGDYPIVERVIRVTVPDGTSLIHKINSGGSTTVAKISETSDGKTTFTWSPYPMAVPASSQETQLLPWQERSPRLRWTTVVSPEHWGAVYLNAVRYAAKTDEGVKTFAEAAIEGDTDAAEQVRKISEKIQKRFNYVNAPQSYRSLNCRSATEVLRANYGNPLEAAALHLAAFRSLGIDADVELAMDANAWNEGDLPTESVFAGVVVVAKIDSQPVYVHPEHGVFTNPGHWGKHWLLALDGSGVVQNKTRIRSRGEEKGSEFNVSGKIAISENGAVDGELRVRLTGAFYDPRKLKTADSQKAFIEGIAERVLTGPTVSSYSISTLSDASLHATINLSGGDVLPHSGPGHVLMLGDGPAFLDDFHMPLERSYRRSAVRMAGRFRETVDLTVEISDNQAAYVVPAGLPSVSGHWGAIRQDVKIGDRSIRVQRQISLTTDTISAKDFSTVREAINSLRANGSLSFLIGSQGSHYETQ